MSDRIMGIDPGRKGGVAVYETSTRKFLYRKPLFYKGNTVDVCHLQDMIIAYRVRVIGVEAQQVRGRQRGQLSVGIGYGQILATGTLCGANMLQVQPKTWQTWTHGRPTSDKSATIDLLHRWGHAVPMTSNRSNARHHDGVADAMAIALYVVNSEGLIE